MKCPKGKSKCDEQKVEPRQTFFENVLERAPTIRTVAAILGLKDQYRYPMGRRGRHIAKLMNQGYEPLTLWGLTKVKIASNNVILGFGLGLNFNLQNPNTPIYILNS